MIHPLSTSLLCAGLALVSFSTAQAEPRSQSRGVAVQAANGARAAESGRTLVGNRGAATDQRGVTADGNGNAQGAVSGGFTTEFGAHGHRKGTFQRSDDGSVNASGESTTTGRSGGSAHRSASFDRSADGSATGQRSTTATNANTGVTFDGQATYTKGSGVSRSGSCTNASGQSVTCGSAR